MGASLVQKFVGARGWGALTEHHLLVAIRDAIMAEPDTTMHRSISAAVACCARSTVGVHKKNRTVSDTGQRLIALAVHAQGAISSTVPELDVYSCAVAPETSAAKAAAAARQSCVHLLLAPPPGGVEEMSLVGCWGEVGVVQCSLPSGLDCGSSVRTIVALQGHNNCGRLYGAATRLAQQAVAPAATAIATFGLNEKRQRGKNKKKEKKSSRDKQRSDQQDQKQRKHKRTKEQREKKTISEECSSKAIKNEKKQKKHKKRKKDKKSKKHKSTNFG